MSVLFWEIGLYEPPKKLEPEKLFDYTARSGVNRPSNQTRYLYSGIFPAPGTRASLWRIVPSNLLSNNRTVGFDTPPRPLRPLVPLKVVCRTVLKVKGECDGRGLMPAPGKSKPRSVLLLMRLRWVPGRSRKSRVTGIIMATRRSKPPGRGQSAGWGTPLGPLGGG